MAVTLAPAPVSSGRKNMRKGQPYPLPLGPRRAAGTNPRARGTNPRAVGTNPRAGAADGTKARAAQTRLQRAQADRRAANRQNLASNGRGSLVALSEAHSAPQPNPTVVVDGAAMELAPSGGLTMAQNASFARKVRAEQLAASEEGGEPP